MAMLKADLIAPRLTVVNGTGRLKMAERVPVLGLNPSTDEAIPIYFSKLVKLLVTSDLKKPLTPR